jgi:hypothetical protein
VPSSASVGASAVLTENRETVRRARELTARHAILVDCVRASAAAGRENRAVAWTMWERVSARRAAYLFWLSAYVDGVRRFAVWSDNGLLVHPELAARAALVIQLGETFEAAESACSVPAGLDEPIQAVLTLIRAADQVVEFNLRVDELTVAYRADKGAA